MHQGCTQGTPWYPPWSWCTLGASMTVATCGRRKRRPACGRAPLQSSSSAGRTRPASSSSFAATDGPVNRRRMLPRTDGPLAVRPSAAHATPHPDPSSRCSPLGDDGRASASVPTKRWQLIRRPMNMCQMFRKGLASPFRNPRHMFSGSYTRSSRSSQERSS